MGKLRPQEAHGLGQLTEEPGVGRTQGRPDSDSTLLSATWNSMEILQLYISAFYLNFQILGF